MDRVSPPTAEVWVDVVCPWAYVGLDRTALLRELGFEVRTRSFELHPEIPRGGIEVRPTGRLAATHLRVAELCDEAGMPFHAPTRVPNSRLALEWTQAVAAVDPERYEEVFRRFFAARFVDDADLGDVGVVTALVEASGVDLAAAAEAVADGTGAARMLASVDEARSEGIAATPAWRFEGGFVLPGVHDREQVARWARRLAERGPRASGLGGDGQ